MNLVSKKTALRCAVALVALAWGSAAWAQTKTFDVPSEDAVKAIPEFARQGGIQIVAPADQLRGVKTPALSGTIDLHVALSRLLEGTGIEIASDDGQTIVLRVRSKNVEAAQNERAANSGAVETVTVTGTRIPVSASGGAQDVKVFDRKKIAQSGQSTISEFLNAIPSAAVSVTENGDQTFGGGTTVQLRGLPVGTTLVLINGRRVETSGSQAFANFFDLNNIPLAAVDRIEVDAEGSSAIYGSDAIAGVVNVILRKDLDGVEASTRYGGASGTDDWEGNLAWGTSWDKGAISIIGTYMTRSELSARERALTRDNNYTAFGGPNRDFPVCDPANVFSRNGGNLPGLSAPFAAVPPGFSGTPSIQEFQNTAGTLNQCSFNADISLLPATRRLGIFAQGTYELTSAVELFAELIYSHVEEFQHTRRPSFFGVFGFQSFTVGASNPYNPFGQTVGISDYLTGLPKQGQFLDTTFLRPVVGLRGSVFGDWHWEVSAHESVDFTDEDQPLAIEDDVGIQNALNSSDPATAFNPFVIGSAGNASVLRRFYSDAFSSFTGRSETVDGYVRGNLFDLPAGPVQVVLGGEYNRDTLHSKIIIQAGGPSNVLSTFHRDAYAVFGEVRIPIIGNSENPDDGDRLAVTLAGRHDNYSDFGGTNTPQVSAEWRPLDGLLVRGTYANAFKAPSLFSLHTPQSSALASGFDPVTNQNVTYTQISGGNPNLQPETGQSHTIGFVYSGDLVPGLRLSVTDWDVIENNSVRSLLSQIILANESLFPGKVVRPSVCAGGPPCPPTSVQATFVNFGKIDVAGLDYQIDYRFETDIGVWTPSLNATQIYRYTASFIPGQPATSRLSKANDDFVWAPQWKGTVALGWEWGEYSAHTDARYTGSYQDYDSTRKIGDFWLVDANFRWAIGQTLAPSDPLINQFYVEVGAVNLFDTPPQYSNYIFSFVGYDGAQADIRGRYLYAQAGIKW